MAIQWISANWKAAQKTMALDERVYIDFRQQVYPDSGTGAPTFSVVSSTDNVSGSHYMSGGWGDYLIGLTSTVSITAYVKPTFGYDVASDQTVWSWYIDATHKLDCFYRAADDLFCVSWQDGGTRRELTSPAYASNPSLQSWVDLTLTFNGSQVEQTGSKFWVNGSKVDEDWGGANDVVASYFPKLTIRGENATSAGFQIAYVRVFPNLKEDYSGNYKTRKNEEIVWHMNGVAHGRTRCNVTARVQDMSIEKAIESPLGRSVASRMNLTLLSPTGQFADDQYGTFTPTSEAYNGSSSQKFLQNRTPVEVETWYGGTYEHEFVGRVSEEKFTRHSGYGVSSRVRISSDDALWDMKKRVKRNSSAYEDYKLSSPASAGTSLLHTLTYLASDREWYNFAPNASFETATGIASSVTIVGTGATFTQLLTTTSIHGSAVGFLQASVNASMDWIVQFGTSKNINVGQKWTASAYVKSNTVTSAGFSIVEYDGTSTVGSTVDSQNLVASTWTIMQATYTVTTSTADIFRIRFDKTGSSSCQIDNLQLVQNNERLPWVINTTMVGSAGTTQSSSAQSAVYHTIGIDADDADFVQGYQVVKAGNTIWGYMQELANATVAMYLGMTSCNTLKYRTPLKTGYADPTVLFTVGINTQDINSIMNTECANKVVVKGCMILKDTTVRTIWNAAATGSFDMNGQLLNVACTAGSYFPDKVAFGDYWAEYSNVSAPRASRTKVSSQFAGANPIAAPTNIQGEEILGVKEASLVLRTLSCGTAVQPMTLTTFDTTTRPDAANILLYNSTGNNQTISSCSIRGKLIRKTASGKGFVHDAFVDYERIEKDGEQSVEFESDMITSRSQTDKVANYIWKRNRSPKHIYRTTEPGMLSYYEPGEWYTLRVGGAGGIAEYVDSTAECYSVTQQRGIGTIGNTTLEFRELLENWKWDSNEYTRFMAPGDPNSSPYTNVVTIGDQYCTMPVTFLCGATSCNTEIQSAIDWLSQTYGGGKVRVTEGTYSLSAAIELKSNVYLELDCGSTLEKNCNDYAIKAVGSTASHIQYCMISGGGKITRNASDTNVKALVYFDYVDDSSIRGATVDDGDSDGIYLLNCDSVTLGDGVKITNCDGTGLKTIASIVIIGVGLAITGCGIGYENWPGIDVDRIDHGDCESADEPMLDSETVPWAYRSTWARSSAQKYSGTYSYLFSLTGGAAMEGVCALNDNDDKDDLHGLTAGKTYRATGKMYVLGAATTPASKIHLLLNYSSDGANWTKTIYATPLEEYDAWQDINLIFNLPVGTTGASLKWWVEDLASLTEDVFHADEIHVYEFDDTDSGCQLVNCAVSDCTDTGVIVANSHALIQNNQITGNTNKGLVIAAGYRNMVSSNRCYNNGADTGLANTNQDNFYDAGIDTQLG